VACFARWLANDFPPWAAYQALMTAHLLTDHLLTLDKIWESGPLALVTLGIGYLPSPFFMLLVLQPLRHVVLINSVLAYLLV